MYHLKGVEFADLIRREFTDGFETGEATGLQKGRFSCHTRSLREKNFDILHFYADFQQPVQVTDLKDTSHVSLHFQLSGHSDACISGFNNALPMATGHFNVLNCVDPVSSFAFPAQQKYEYLCIGLKPSFFGQILSEAGPAYDKLLRQSERGQSFSLFSNNRIMDPLQSDVLKLIQFPPIADNLRLPYIRSKVKELTILTLGQYHEKKVS